MCKNLRTKKDDECVCKNLAIEKDDECVCKNLTIEKDGECVCKNLTIEKDNECVCKNLTIEKDNECVCTNLAIKKDDECVCKDLAYGLDNKCVCNDLAYEKNGVCLCKEGAYVSNGECFCKKGFYLKNNQCYACYKQCKECSDSDMDSCTECYYDLHLLPEGICGKCSLGYIKTNNICEVKENIIFNLDFNNKIAGELRDSASNIKVITGSSSKFYPDYENDDPYASYLRGFYLNGKTSYLAIKSNKFTLPHSFQVVFWVNFELGNGTVFQKEGLLIGIDSFAFKTCIQLTEGPLCLKSLNLIEKATWVKIIISFKFESKITTIKYFEETPISLDGYFIDTKNVGYIGKGEEYMKGFLYNFEINTYQSASRALLTCLDSCSECLESGECIPNCGLTEYWAGPSYKDCNKCSNKCGKGCRNLSSCSLCADEICKSCNSLKIESSCDECFTNAILNGTCVCGNEYTWNPYTLKCFKCESYQYLNLLSCLNCTAPCSTCTDSLNCISCGPNSTLQGSMCYCDIGYKSLDSKDYMNDCQRHILDVEFNLSSDNEVNLFFSEDLKNNLDENDFEVQVDGNWKIKKISDNEYKIKISYKNSVKETQKISVTINSTNAVSVTNATLNVSEYSSSLNEMGIGKDIKFYNARKSSRIVFATFTVFFIVCSLLTSNFALLWIFISYIQLLMYIVLSSVPIGSRSKGLLVGMRFYNFFPNVFKMFLPDGKNLNFKYSEDFGYDGEFFLVNIGEILLLFIVFSFLFLITLVIEILVKKEKIVNTHIVKYNRIILDYFKFIIPIRFLLIFYAEFCVATFLALRNLEFKDSIESANGVISIFVCVFLVVGGLLIFFSIIFKYNKKIEKEEQIDQNIGVLCNEIDSSKGYLSNIYFLVFSLRRVVFAIILIASKGNGILQMVLIVFMNCVIILYLFTTKPFKDKYMNYYNITNEISTSVIFILLSIFVKDISDSSINQLDLTIFCLIYVFYAIQILLCIWYLRDVRRRNSIVFLKTVRTQAPNLDEQERKNRKLQGSDLNFRQTEHDCE